MRAFLVLLLLATTAKAQFDLQDSHTTASLRGIHSLGGGVAWASGTNGTVLRTEDGGYLWQTCTIPPGAEKLDFRGIQAFDAQTAIVMSSGPGDLSRLYKTTDGCQTWTLLFTNPDKDGFFDAIQFERNAGWILGDPVNGKFQVWWTDDGGKKWLREPLKKNGLDADPKTQGAFAASNSSLNARPMRPLFGSGGTGGAFVYEVGDSTICVDDCTAEESRPQNVWHRIDTPLAFGEGAGVFSVGIRSGKIGDCAGVIVGGNYTKPESASGTSAFKLGCDQPWTLSARLPHGYRSAVAYDPTTKTWITVGPNGTDISKDDGKNWQPLKPGPQDQPDADKNWNALSLPFVVGPKGRIGKLRSDALSTPSENPALDKTQPK